MEFTFEGTGKLNRIDTYTSKAGKTILTLIVETDGQYPQLIPFKVFGRLAETATWKPGAALRIEGRLGGREWNNKVYGDNVANVVEVVEAAKEPQTQLPVGEEDDTPF
jgi:single-stranded DNA-binding protein